MRKQELDLGNDLSEAIDFALQVFLRNASLGRPCLGEEARADAQTQHRGRLPAAPLQSNGLADQAAAGRDLSIGLAFARGMLARDAGDDAGAVAAYQIGRAHV